LRWRSKHVQPGSLSCRSAGSVDEARQRLGAYFADVLLLDQQAYAHKARTQLGWTPSGPSLVDEFVDGTYSHAVDH
jgi:hypothetical protein